MLMCWAVFKRTLQYSSCAKGRLMN
uniref:Uncharacterized protein n=1 Tax=Arundo donax TaxID=35708 RepID=A0A0A8Z5J4_ARUDO